MLDFKKHGPVRNRPLKSSLERFKGAVVHSRWQLCFPSQGLAASCNLARRQGGPALSLSLSQWGPPSASILPLHSSFCFLLHCPEWLSPIPRPPRNSPGTAPEEGLLSPARIHFLAWRDPCRLYPFFAGRAKVVGLHGRCPAALTWAKCGQLPCVNFFLSLISRQFLK